MDPPSRIELPKSRLRVSGAHLQRLSSRDTLIAEHSLGEISDVAVLRPIDPMGVTFFAFAAAGAGACLRFMPWTGWRWAATATFVLLALISLLGLYGTKLKLTLAHGDVTYDVSDTPDDVAGFALSLKRLAQEHRLSESGASRHASPDVRAQQ